MEAQNSRYTPELNMKIIKTLKNKFEEYDIALLDLPDTLPKNSHFETGTIRLTYKLSEKGAMEEGAFRKEILEQHDKNIDEIISKLVYTLKGSKSILVSNISGDEIGKDDQWYLFSKHFKYAYEPKYRTRKIIPLKEKKLCSNTQ